jgi:hypothetical protein
MEWQVAFPQEFQPSTVVQREAPSRRSDWEPKSRNWKLPGIMLASRLGDRPRPAMAASGVAAVDALTGGFPRGALTEICGAASSGRTSLLLAAMAQATARGEVVALVDAGDCFDPASAEAAGVDLKRVLWVRCNNFRLPISDCRMARKQSAIGNRKSAIYGPVEQALKATDLLLQAGGFGMVVVDCGDVPEQVARRVPLTSWFRFRRAVEHTDTVLLAMTREACAKSCASLVLKLTADGRRLTADPPHAQLLSGLEIRAEVLRDAVQGKKPVQSAARFASATDWQRKLG